MWAGLRKHEIPLYGLSSKVNTLQYLVNLNLTYLTNNSSSHMIELIFHRNIGHSISNQPQPLYKPISTLIKAGY